MSFREKSAWITLATVLGCFGVYFGSIVTGHLRGGGGVIVVGEGPPHLLVLCVLALVVLQAALHAAAAITTPRGDRAVRDERERLIQANSHTVGYYVLVAMVLGLGVPGHMGHSVRDLLNFALLGVVVAALAVSGAQIVMFRRGV